MANRTVSAEFVVCPGCGEKHAECADWVKSMPHRELCSCGAELLVWFEEQRTYHAELLQATEAPKVKQSKKGKKKSGKKDRRKEKKDKKRRKKKR
jgi:hypothetical protein